MEETMRQIFVVGLVISFFCGIIAAQILSNKGRSGFGGFGLGFFLGIFGVIIALVMQPTQEAQEITAIRRGVKRRCPHCQSAISSEARICPACRESVYPPLLPITRDKVDNLLRQINRQSLTSPPEEYWNNAWTHWYNWQTRETVRELAKVLLVSHPDSPIHDEARKWLEGLGYRF